MFLPAYWATESGRQEAARQRLQAEAMTRGAKLYISNCAVCHGPAGEGKIGPALKDNPLDESALRKIIIRGVPGTAMPAFGEEDGGPLKRHQIEDLVTFIRNWNQSLVEALASPVPTPTLAPEPAPKPKPEPSQAPAGKSAAELYGAKCATCHGPKQQGVPGVGPALTPESLANLSDAQIKDIILNSRPNTTMPAWKDILSSEEIEHLIQFIKYTSP